jgi:hypothetical protein
MATEPGLVALARIGFHQLQSNSVSLGLAVDFNYTTLNGGHL